MFLLLLSFVSGAYSSVVASYDFATPGPVLKDISGQNILGDLQLHGDVTWLPDRIGIRVGVDGFLQSMNSVSQLLATMTTDFSIELFIATDYTSETNRPPIDETGPAIFGISRNYTAPGPLAPCDCPPADPGSSLELRFSGWNQIDPSPAGWINAYYPKRTATPASNCSCFLTGNNPTTNNKNLGMTHVVMTTANLYTNGLRAAPTGSFSSLKPWDPTNLDPLSSFFLAPIHTPNVSTYVGNFFKLVIYNETLSAANVTTAFKSWIQNSPPHSSNSTISYPEDLSVQFRLTAFDLDDLRNTSEPENVTCFVATLPVKGWLSYDGVNLTSIMLPFPVARNASIPFVFGAAQYEFGVAYTSFDFYCSDPLSQGNTATITFDITHVNHPPSTMDVKFTATRGVEATLYLNGTDIDGDSIAGVRIVSLPMYGNLSQTSGEIFTLSNINDELSGTSDLDGWPVNYIATSNTGLSGAENVYNDTFTFEVKDEFGEWSRENSTVTILVLNNLEAAAPGSFADVSAKQASNSQDPTLISLPGTDSKGGTFDAIITSLPTTGTFYKANMDPLTVADLPFNCYQDPSTAGPATFIFYRPVPYSLQSANFTYQLVQPEDNDWKSPVAAAQISISPTNYPPVVTIDTPFPILIKDHLTTTFSVSFFDWNNGTTAGEAGDGYVISVNALNDGVVRRGGAKYRLTCGDCTESLTLGCTGLASCPGLDEANLLFEYYGSKANLSNLILSLHSIGLTGFTPGEGIFQVTVRNGVPGPIFFGYPSTSYAVVTQVNFTYEISKQDEDGPIPQYGLYIIYIGGPIVTICCLFFCIRWCLKCCLCCQRTKKTEPYKDQYETAAGERL